MARRRRNPPRARRPKPRNLTEALRQSDERMGELESRRKLIDAAIRRYERNGGNFLIRGRLGHALVRTTAALDRENERRRKLVRDAEERYDAERGHRPVKKNAGRRVRNPDGGLLPIVVAGGAAAALYWFLLRPWIIQQELAEQAKKQIAAGVASGMSLTDAADKAVGAACVAVSTVYKVPPSASGPICQGVGVLAVAGAKEAVKGAVIAGKVVGKETAKGAKAVAGAAKKAVSAVSHGFGLWGLGDLGDGPRSSGVGRARRGRMNQAAAAAFYLRHL